MSSTFEGLVQTFRPRMLISVREAAEVIGVHYKTVYRPGYEIPKREIGGCRVVHLGDLAAWIDALKKVDGEGDGSPDQSLGGTVDTEALSEARRKRGRPRKSERLQS